MLTSHHACFCNLYCSQYFVHVVKIVYSDKGPSLILVHCISIWSSYS